MNPVLLNELSQITPEEHEILSGRHDIDKQLYTEKEEMIIDCKKLLKHGKLIEIRTHTRFVHFPVHTHNYIEVIYMCSGSTTHIIDGKKVVLQTGDLLFLNQNVKQEVFPADAGDIAVNFIILPEFFDTVFTMLGEEENLLRDFLVGCLCERDAQIHYLHFQVADVLPIQNLVENLIWSLKNDSSNKRHINQVTMGLLFLQLLNYTDQMYASSHSFEEKLILHVLHYIDEHYKDASLTELAKELGYDVYWLSRTIKKYTGQTYKALLQTKRFNQALYLLQHTTLSVNDIILATGYDNTSYFYRTFKRRFNLSPSDYRKLHMTSSKSANKDAIFHK